MLDLGLYRRYYGSHPSESNARKDNSTMITEATWWRDTASCLCYVYDYDADDERDITYGLSPQNNPQKIAIECKYIINSYNSDDKVQVAYHLMFKPSQEDRLKEISERMVKKYGMQDKSFNIYPIGLYVDIPDKDKVYRRYMIMGFANAYDSQSPTWTVLPCDERFVWMYNHKIYKMWGCKRSISNYDSGVWEDHKTEIANDQQKFIVPYNEETSTLFYNLRMVLSAPMESPLTWRVSKVDNVTPRGIVKITLLQDKFDQNYDYVGHDEDGNYLAVANYYRTKIIEDDEGVEPETEYTGVVTYNGNSPSIRIGGSAKTFTVTYYKDGEVIEPTGDIEWHFVMNDEDVSDLFRLTYSGSSVTAKFLGDEDHADSVVNITAVCDGITAAIEIELIL